MNLFLFILYMYSENAGPAHDGSGANKTAFEYR